ncbi:MAG: hypothetical protein ACXAC5_02035 [Promethearchaeota archaeon]
MRKTFRQCIKIDLDEEFAIAKAAKLKREFPGVVVDTLRVTPPNALSLWEPISARPSMNSSAIATMVWEYFPDTRKFQYIEDYDKAMTLARATAAIHTDMTKICNGNLWNWAEATLYKAEYAYDPLRGISECHQKCSHCEIVFDLKQEGQFTWQIWNEFAYYCKNCGEHARPSGFEKPDSTEKSSCMDINHDGFRSAAHCPQGIAYCVDGSSGCRYSFNPKGRYPGTKSRRQG